MKDERLPADFAAKLRAADYHALKTRHGWVPMRKTFTCGRPERTKNGALWMCWHDYQQNQK